MITVDALRSWGADVEDGLHRCMNMEPFYLKLVSSLKGDRRTAELRSAIEAGDLKTAFETAHAMVGALENLSLTPLARPVRRITELLRSGKETDYGPLLEEIEKRDGELQAML